MNTEFDRLRRRKSVRSVLLVARLFRPFFYRRREQARKSIKNSVDVSASTPTDPRVADVMSLSALVDGGVATCDPQRQAPVDPRDMMEALGPTHHRLFVSIVQDDARTPGGIQTLSRIEAEKAQQQGFKVVKIWPTVPRGYDCTDGECVCENFSVLVDGDVMRTSSTALTETFRRFNSDGHIVSVQSLVGHCLAAITKTVSALPQAKVFTHNHDFFAVCHNDLLMRNNVEFCGGPPLDSDSCQICAFGPMRKKRVQQFHDFVSASNSTLVFPSDYAQQAIVSMYPNDLSGFTQTVLPPVRLIDSAFSARASEDTLHDKLCRSESWPIRIAFVGHAIDIKGFSDFERLLGVFGADPRYELCIISSDAPNLASSLARQIEAHASAENPYETVGILKREQVDVVFIAPTKRETFMIVAYEALAAGCIIALVGDSGNPSRALCNNPAALVFQSVEDLILHMLSGEFGRSVRGALRRPQALEVSLGIFDFLDDSGGK